MNIVTCIFALLAAVLHVLIFCMESLWFMNPRIYQRFGAKTQQDAEARQLFAFNQGFYNLFLAIGIFIGVFLIYFSPNYLQISQTLILFNCASMVCAALVLWFSGGMKMLRAVIIQATFPLLAGIFWLFLH